MGTIFSSVALYVKQIPGYVSVIFKIRFRELHAAGFQHNVRALPRLDLRQVGIQHHGCERIRFGLPRQATRQAVAVRVHVRGSVGNGDVGAGV